MASPAVRKLSKKIAQMVLAVYVLGGLVLLFMSPEMTTIMGAFRKTVFVIPSVESGTLHALHFDNGTSIVTYNLSAAFRYRNPYIYGMRVSWLAAAPSYGGQNLGPDTDLPSFKLRPKKATTVPLDVQGRQVVAAELAAGFGRTYADDASRGYYTIETKLNMKVGISHHRCDLSCNLYFPAPAAPTGVIIVFDGDQCTTKC